MTTNPFPILIVDDDEISADVLASVLRGDGYDVDVAHNGQQALDMILKHGHRLVISDWMMPGMDGLELCQQVRGLSLEAYVYFILVTSKEDADDVVNALNAGADDFLTKPFNPAELRVRVRAGERIRRSRDDLETQVQQRTAQLMRSNRDLEQFAYVASHDLQEPLRMVSSYLQLIKRRYAEALDQDGLEFIEFAVDGAVHMKLLIEDLLAYSRVTSRAEVPVATDCEVVLSQSLSNLKIAIQESGAIVTRDPLPIVMSDEMHLSQLFQNLITNAIKYRSPDRAPEIHISSETRESEWLFGVRDNGLGIDEAFKDRIFVIFQRLHGRNEYSGTGIGLAVCKKLVERYGGRIWVESTPNEGSVFYFTISKLTESHKHAHHVVQQAS